MKSLTDQFISDLYGSLLHVDADYAAVLGRTTVIRVPRRDAGVHRELPKKPTPSEGLDDALDLVPRHEQA